MESLFDLDTAIREFSNELAVPLEFSATGAVKLTGTNGNEINIETHPGSTLLIMHTPFGKIEEQHLSVMDIRKMLELNAHQYKMRGAWLAIGEENTIPRLCTSVPVSVVSKDILMNLFNNLIELSLTAERYLQELVKNNRRPAY